MWFSLREKDGKNGNGDRYVFDDAPIIQQKGEKGEKGGGFEGQNQKDTHEHFGQGKPGNRGLDCYRILSSLTVEFGVF